MLGKSQELFSAYFLQSVSITYHDIVQHFLSQPLALEYQYFACNFSKDAQFGQGKK